jgi:hypothetical protein
MTGAPGPGHPGGVWDPNRWNSARCDTAELNLFPATGNGANLPKLSPGVWASMYHESDPKFAVLGIPRPRCFLIDPSPGAPVDETNLTCGDVAPYPPPWTGAPGSGFDPNEIPGLPGWTREYTKIIPDGLLTPGTHVEYFLRRSSASAPAAFAMAPDTMRIVPQPAMNDLDGHRWQEFSVLPDRWKDPAFGGQGMACMLFVDFGDRRGDELAWVAAMDSIGGTAPARRGAHNGWKARGDQDPTLGVDPAAGGDTSMAVRAHPGQAGTVWDLYSVHGAESATTGASFASRRAAPGLGRLAGRTATNGPTGGMLRAFYPAVVLDFADLGSGGAATLGPFPGRSDDDVGLLQDYASGADGLPAPRAVWALGRNFAESQANAATGHPGFTEQFFGASLRSPSYRAFTGSTANVVDLRPAAAIAPDSAIYGVLSSCQVDLDVLGVYGGVAGAQAAATLFDVTTTLGTPPFVASVIAPPGPSHPHLSQLDAFRLPNLGSRFTLTRGGARRYALQAVTRLFAALNCGPLSVPVGVGDGPVTPDAAAFALALRSGNPSHSGTARFTYTLAAPGHAELRVYDLAGRTVRRLVDRLVPAGVEQAVTWDGTDDRGRAVPDGVYFYRLRSGASVTERKLTILRR